MAGEHEPSTPMKNRLRSPRTWLYLSLGWVIVLSLAGRRVPQARATMHSAAAVGSNPLATTRLVPPTNLRATWLGANVVLVWSAGRNGAGYVILGSANQTPQCTATAWMPIGRVAPLTVTIFLDRQRVVPKGKWYCYMVETLLRGWASSPNPTTVVREPPKTEGATPTVTIIPSTTAIGLVTPVRLTPTQVLTMTKTISTPASTTIATATHTATPTLPAVETPVRTTTASRTPTATPTVTRLALQTINPIPTLTSARTQVLAVTATATRVPMPTVTELLTPTVAPATARAPAR